MNGLAWAALGFGLVIAAGFGLAALGSSRWQALTESTMARLEAAREPMPGGRYDAHEIDGLPAPV